MIRPTIDENTRLRLARRHVSIPSLLLAIASSEHFISLQFIYVREYSRKKEPRFLLIPHQPTLLQFSECGNFQMKTDLFFLFVLFLLFFIICWENNALDCRPFMGERYIIERERNREGFS